MRFFEIFEKKNEKSAFFRKNSPEDKDFLAETGAAARRADMQLLFLRDGCWH